MVRYPLILAIDGNPYTIPSPEVTTLVLCTDHGELSIRVQATDLDWGPHMIRIEGLVDYNNEVCRLVAAYQVGIEPTQEAVGKAQLYTSEAVPD
ncbi:hypothetical protein BS297_00825 [Rhodococcus erythropolis]|uniref:Uncharacterized protein n=1 Tax=Rhodococcus erythropolis TaxID=1833 RepID=A0A0C3AB65_RHOER|nr:hypothetical protein BS297_15860 [Rhodococcus erythropolis]KAB2587255.1 hypothetical protein BS297_00825 [Rhodococcus erythropolis]KIM16581.1 hypothetical protein QV65_13070 [Rhodococcus erythropolis]